MNSKLKKSNVVTPAQLWLGIAMIVLTIAAYWPVFSAKFIWDDDDWIIHNQYLRTTDGLWQMWFVPAATPQYYPLVLTGFWLEYHFWELNPLGFHVVNVVCHVFGALLLWQLLKRLKLPGAWLVAAIFAVHPVEVESVAWVTELKNVLSAVFYFLAALTYLRFSGLEQPNDPPGKPDWRFYLLALLLFGAALLCKTVTCSLPAALLLIGWWKKGRVGVRHILPLAPFFALGAGLGLFTAWVEKHQVGASGADWSFTFADRCLIAGRALFFYAAKLFVPAQLVFIYPRWDINAHVWWQWLFPTAAAAVVIGLWLARHRIGRGPLMAVLFFAGTLAPALGFVNVYPMKFSFVADHFQYLAGIGLMALAVGAAAKFLELHPVRSDVVTVCVCLLLLGLATRTWLQCGIYQNLETLWTDTIGKNPRCWMAHSNLGWLLAEQGRPDEAELHYQTALALDPNEESIHYNYGNLLARAGRLDEAARQYRDAQRLAPAKPEPYNNLGIVLNRQHRTDEAIAEYQRAILRKPDYADAYFNLGNALSAEHKMDAAINAYQHALRLRPDSELFRKRLQALGVLEN